MFPKDTHVRVASMPVTKGTGPQSVTTAAPPLGFFGGKHHVWTKGGGHVCMGWWAQMGMVTPLGRFWVSVLMRGFLYPPGHPLGCFVALGALGGLFGGGFGFQLALSVTGLSQWGDLYS